MQVRSDKTLLIEAMIREGTPVSSIAREIGVSRGRVQQIKRRMSGDYSLVTDTPSMIEGSGGSTFAGLVSSASPMKSLTVHFTPAVHDALVEACAITNRQSPEEPITIADYVEELVINRVVELGLLRKNKRK